MKLLDIFNTIKNNVTTREAAVKYGISVGRNGMCVCPFHNDHDPSMKVDKRYHCFGCQADGDVINFTARLYQLSQKDAAIKLAADFNISVDKEEQYVPKPSNSILKQKQIFKQQLSECFITLANYYHQLQRWKEVYAPKTDGVEWDSRFIEAIRNLEPIDYALDILIFGSDEEKRMILNEYQGKGIVQMEGINQTPIYYHSGAYAREHNELEAFRASHRENVACKNDIDETVSRNFDGMHLNQIVVSDILARHDSERVKLVLASTIQDKEWDGRFSRSNKEWASSVQLPDTATESGFDRRYDYSVDTHPAVLDGFVNMFRTEINEREKSSVLSSLHSQHTHAERSIKPKEQEACL